MDRKVSFNSLLKEYNLASDNFTVTQPFCNIYRPICTPVSPYMQCLYLKLGWWLSRTEYKGDRPIFETRVRANSVYVYCPTNRIIIIIIIIIIPLTLQPTVGFGLSNNVLPFFPICHQLSPSSHSQHLKNSLYFLFPSFPGSSPSSRPFQFLSEDLFGHPIVPHSL